MSTLSLSPVSAAVIALLRANVTFASRAKGGVQDVIPQNVTWPFALVEAREERDLRGMGTGTLPEVIVRLSAFSKQGSMKEAQDLLDAGIEALKDQPISATGFTHCGGSLFYDGTTPLPNTEVNGTQGIELVASFRGYFEKAA